MKGKRNYESFIEDLKKRMKSLKEMKEGEVHVFTVNANYGRYKIMVGPLKRRRNCPLEIEGEIHHLFVSPQGVKPNPSRNQVRHNLKQTVIMRDLAVHINDPSGTGRRVSLSQESLHPREMINLAGKQGEEMMKKAQARGRLSMAAYHIIQKDILKSLEKKEKKHTRQQT